MLAAQLPPDSQAASASQTPAVTAPRLSVPAPVYAMDPALGYLCPLPLT